jgi:hypothetical protein
MGLKACLKLCEDKKVMNYYCRTGEKTVIHYTRVTD